MHTQENLYHYLTGCPITFLADINPVSTKKIRPKSSFKDADFDYPVFHTPLGHELQVLIQQLVQPDPDKRLPLSKANPILKTIEKLLENINHIESTTIAQMERVMQNPHLHLLTKLNYLQMLETKGLLKPLIRQMWKENRSQNISSPFFCQTSEAESAYRAIQKIYDNEQEGENRVLSVLTIIQKYVLNNKGNQQPFFVALSHAFGLDVINYIQDKPTNSSNRETLGY